MSASSFLARATGVLVLLLSAASALAASKPRPPVDFTAEQAHQHLMDELGITRLRPAAAGDAKAAHPANYDEAKANPYPTLPDPLVMKNGEKVTTADQWWKTRRPQIVEAFSRDVYGYVPQNVPRVTWKVVAVDKERLGATPVIARKIIGHVDNSAYPLVDVNMRMTLVLPANVKGPVPTLIMFTFGGVRFPAPSQPSPAKLDKINAALKAAMVKQDPSLADVFQRHQAFDIVHQLPFSFPKRNEDGDLPSIYQLVAAGWGYAELDPNSIQADNAVGLTRGIIGLANKGQPRKPDQWGALRAWAWGASRALDYLQGNPKVDGKHIGIEGVSRFGKAALVTMAFDRRFAMVLVGSSGKGGATLLRRNWGESVTNLTAGEYYWMAGNFMKYGASKGKFGSMNPGDLPVDSHELIALCAPRLTFISYGIPEKGDSKWLDQKGSFMATVAASKVFRLLGARGLGMGDDYRAAEMPPVNHGLLDGQLAWRQDDGGHTDWPNMKYFIAWANRNIGYAPTPAK
ncbi:MAG TPA: acetylxylan esterase [Alphaproteobacteria bacterium]|nr:acetylxylan esterase [Alphaproteobacteria bacterium]